MHLSTAAKIGGNRDLRSTSCMCNYIGSGATPKGGKNVYLRLGWPSWTRLHSEPEIVHNDGFAA